MVCRLLACAFGSLLLENRTIESVVSIITSYCSCKYYGDQTQSYNISVRLSAPSSSSPGLVRIE